MVKIINEIRQSLKKIIAAVVIETHEVHFNVEINLITGATLNFIFQCIYIFTHEAAVTETY